MTVMTYRRPVTPELVIPQVSWDDVRRRVNRLWRTRESPHHSIVGLTGSGKTYLVRHGLLDMAKWDRVLIVDVKGDDRTLQGLGKPVRHLPGVLYAAKKAIEEEKPRQNWFRLVTYEAYADAHDQVGEAFDRVYAEGDWIVVIDELRAIVDPRPPGINLRPMWERFMLRGRSRGVGMVNLTQEPRWVPGSFYTQPSFLWLSRVEDEASQKRVAEIGGSRALLPHLSRVKKRRWIYGDNEDEDRYWAQTQVVKGGR